MQTAKQTTRYADLTGRQAVITAGLIVAAIAVCLAVSLTKQNPFLSRQQGGRDLAVYRNIVTRVHAGESYYDAAGEELRANGYPTASPFNWRPPTYAWVIGKLPGPIWGQVILCLLAGTTLLLAYNAVQRDGKVWRAVAAVLLLLGVFQWCVDGDAFLAQELWAGVFIALSVCAYALGSWPGGVAAGLAALFWRELALPYCVIAAFLAWRDGRRREVLVWLAGFMLYAIFLTYHAQQVGKHITPADRLPSTWIQFGGLSFILKTCRMNVFLLALPGWVSAIYLPLAVLGLLGWRGATALRVALTVGAYFGAFAVVGQPFNEYWGLLYAALLPFGIVRAPAAIRDLAHGVRQAFPQRKIAQSAQQA